jgi:hypothetical protein
MNKARTIIRAFLTFISPTVAREPHLMAALLCLDGLMPHIL